MYPDDYIDESYVKYLSEKGECSSGFDQCRLCDGYHGDNTLCQSDLN